MKLEAISEFLHQLADLQGAFETSFASLENPKGNHDLARKIQSNAIQRMRFVTSEFRNKFKETKNMKTSDLALMGLLAAAPGFVGAETSVPKKVALILKASGNAFYDGIVIGAKEEAAKNNYQVTTVFGSNEDDWQFEDNFLEKEADNYDAFILDPIRSDVFAKSLRKIKEKGKPVVIIDSPLAEGSESILATISSDNFTGGKLAALFVAGELLDNQIAKPCVAHFSGNPRAKGHQDRNEGFLTTLKAKIPSVVVKTYLGLSSFEQAKKVALENFDAISRCDAVFAGSDTMILGVLKAFEERKVRAPEIMVGYDAILEAQKKILSGKLTASVEQFPSQMGIRSIQAIQKHFSNETVEKTQLVTPQLSMRKLEVKTYSEKDLETVQPKPKKDGTKG